MNIIDVGLVIAGGSAQALVTENPVAPWRQRISGSFGRKPGPATPNGKSIGKYKGLFGGACGT